MKCQSCEYDLKYDNSQAHASYRCVPCQRLWLPAKFVKSIGTVKAFDYMGFVGQVQSQIKESTDLGCPFGCGELHLHSYEGSHFCYCHQCSGIWFAQGELERFLNNIPDATDAKNMSAADSLDLFDTFFSVFK